MNGWNLWEFRRPEHKVVLANRLEAAETSQRVAPASADCLCLVDQPSKLLPLPALLFDILTFTYSVSFPAFASLIFSPARCNKCYTS